MTQNVLKNNLLTTAGEKQSKPALVLVGEEVLYAQKIRENELFLAIVDALLFF